MKTYMKNVGSIAGVGLATLLFAYPAAADNSQGSVSVVGVWSCQQTLTTNGLNDQDYFIETFHGDGTDYFVNTALDSQNVSFAPTGVYGTALEGLWKYKDPTHVQRVASFLVNVKLPAFDSVPAYIAGAAAARALVNCLYTITSQNTMTVTGNVAYYGTGDLNFSKGQLAAPPYPISFVGNCTRLQFGLGS